MSISLSGPSSILICLNRIHSKRIPPSPANIDDYQQSPDQSTGKEKKTGDYNSVDKDEVREPLPSTVPRLTRENTELRLTRENLPKKNKSLSSTERYVSY